MLALEGIDAEAVPVDPGISRFDLALDLTAGPEGMSGYLEYDTALFEAPTAALMATDFGELMRQMGEEPDRPIAGLPSVREIVGRRRDWAS